MEIKVKALDEVESKSTQEVEKELLEKHESAEDQQEVAEDVKVEQPEVETPVVEEPQQVDAPSLNEEDVLSYIKDRYQKEFTSVDDLFSQQQENEELPEDVSAYFRYKKETGRNIEDYVKLNKDYGSMDDTSLLHEYYSQTEEGLDSSDIQDLINDKFSFDEEIDDEKEVKKIQRAKKRELAKARKYLNELKETYKAPLESGGVAVSQADKEAYEAYKKYVSDAQSSQAEAQKKSEWFLQKTSEVFSDEFKGFEFNVNDRLLSFSPGDANELKSKQSNIMTFINKFMSEEGLLTDAKGYHRALSVAMNPDKFARYFYEQGQADAVEDVAKKSKNINMDVRQTPQSAPKSGLKVTAMNPDSGRGLRIRSIKRS